jgi:cobalamin biosynthesis protein CobT
VSPDSNDNVKESEQTDEDEEEVGTATKPNNEEDNNGGYITEENNEKSMQQPISSVNKNVMKRKVPPDGILKPVKTRKTFEPITEDYNIRAAIEKLQEILETAKNIAFKKEDSYDHFGKYIASLLRNVGPPAAVQLQHEITSLILRRTKSYVNQTTQVVQSPISVQCPSKGGTSSDAALSSSFGERNDCLWMTDAFKSHHVK